MSDMTLDTQLQNIAVLIDADNASAKNIDVVLQKIQTLGNIATKKIYGDWSQSNLNGWQEAILRHAIEPMQQFAYVKGKNATDIALVIEAMDLLHSKQYDGFCLVSSDSDFASLAVRIRKEGLLVFGFGKQQAVSSFRQACDEFFEVEALLEAQKIANLKPMSNHELKKDTKLINLLQEAIRDSKPYDQDWVDYSLVAKYLKQHKLDLQKYGYEKPIQLFTVIDLFSIKQDKDKGTLFVRSKQPLPPKKSTTKELQNDKALIQAITTLLQNNPKSEQGWSNQSYIASQLKQQYAKTCDMYGYKKFSDFIIAIRLFDIKKQPNGIYVKSKQPKAPAAPKPQNSPNVPQAAQNDTDTVILNGKIDIFVYADGALDSVLWRLNDAKKVRNDSDIIFYGQTHSADGTLSLDINEVYSGFSCQLDTQDADIARIILTTSHEHDSIANTPVRFVIEQVGKVLFTGTCTTDHTHARTLLLCDLVKVATGWRLMYKNQPTTADLYKLCQYFGVEVEVDQD